MAGNGQRNCNGKDDKTIHLCKAWVRVMMVLRVKQREKWVRSAREVLYGTAWLSVDTVVLILSEWHDTGAGLSDG